MIIGKSEYRLLYLDTNALRNIVTNNDGCLQKFISKFLMGDKKYAPVFSVYNVFELKPYKNIYAKFVELFSVIPCMMLFPYKLILQEEIKAYHEGRPFVLDNNLVNAFSSMGSGESYKIEKFLERLWNDEVVGSEIKNEIKGLREISDCWNSRKGEANELIGKYSGINIRKLYFKIEKETIKKDLKAHGFDISDDFDFRKLPGSRSMEYSYFMRVHGRKSLITPNDVMDVKMSCFAPYVDAVITENYQADLYRHMKGFINPISNLEVIRMSNLKE